MRDIIFVTNDIAWNAFQYDHCKPEDKAKHLGEIVDELKKIAKSKGKVEVRRNLENFTPEGLNMVKEKLVDQGHAGTVLKEVRKQLGEEGSSQAGEKRVRSGDDE